MLSDLGVFLYVQVIFVSIAFWESHIDYVGWAKMQQGWRIKTPVRELTAYHFWMWLVMTPLFLFMPLAIYGWNFHLFWLLVASALTGIVIEDTLWFVLNPKFTMAKWNPQYCDWHKWIKVGKFAIPEFVLIFPILAFLIWLFIL